MFKKERLSSSYLLVLTGLFVLLSTNSVRGQFLVEMIDTSSAKGEGLWSASKNNDHIRISGYMQPQFQWAQTKGIKSYSGGDFATQSDNRFMLRRGRLRFDYAHFSKDGKPVAQVVFQFDGTERGVFIRDFWGRLYENQWELFSFTTGMFARPFGYEVNLSSSDRESPERGRMSQILMRTERDLGIMATFEPRKGKDSWKHIKFDFGVFNGQGLTSPGEYDSYKDFISRLSIKPVSLSDNLQLSVGASLLQGSIVQNTRYVYQMNGKDGNDGFLVDSSEQNIGGKLPRHYYGGDAQLKIKHPWGNSEIRGEYWLGTQTATRTSSETPGEALLGSIPYFVRDFDGAFFYFLQNIVNERHQVGFKYDWYDPNTNVAGMQIGAALNTTPADIKYSTVSFGYNFYYNQHLKLMVWYDMPKNEKTSFEQYREDLPDNVLTCRLQYRF